MQADGTLIELARIDDAMHRIGGVDRTRMGDIHFHGIERLQAAMPSRQILINAYLEKVRPLQPEEPSVWGGITLHSI